MIRMMSLLLTFFVFFMTAAMTLADDTPPSRSPDSAVKTATSNLASTQQSESDSEDYFTFDAEPQPERPSEAVSDNNLEEKSKEMLEEVQPSYTVMRVSWKLVPYAVKYKVTLDGDELITYINSIEVAVNDVSKIFKVTALDYDNNIILDDIDITEVETNPFIVKTTTEFDKMDYAPLYPVYSWVPKHNADYYQVQLLKDGEVVREYTTELKGEEDIYDFYDTEPVNEAGNYYWRVKAMSKYGFALSEWSKETDSTSFKVKAPTKFAAFGDSITHGGGAITVPPSMIIYNWETYCNKAIKNLGKSGDTTDQLVNRFDTDVLPFAPKILIIMGGVNDFRGNILGWHTVSNYKIIMEKCKSNNIIPVFVTPTPINPRLIKHVKFIDPPPYDWQTHYKYACDWIKRQEYFIDLTGEFEDSEGFLRADLTTDGLHPDIEGKKIIGKAVNDWLSKNSLF